MLQITEYPRWWSSGASAFEFRQLGDTPELPSHAGRLAKRELERCIMGREVEIRIHSRDKYHRLIADVVVIE